MARGRIKLAVNIALSIAMLVVCTRLVWPAPEDQKKIGDAIDGLHWSSFWPYLAGYMALLAATHFFRAWRWNNLLHPIGVWLSPGKLLAISSVGFMAILALPFRLGEFVRPALIRQRGKVSVSAALGTVAVERIVDGLLVSVVVFIAFFALRGPGAPPWMMPTAWIALSLFFGATGFLVLALRWPKKTIDTCLKLSLVHYFAPRIAAFLEDKLHALITGFRVLRDIRHLSTFLMWSVLYWLANALSILVLARGFGLDLSFVGALGTMGLTAVGITLPNAPVNAGQFQAFMVAGLSLYLGSGVADNRGLLFAIACHLIQVIWYVGCGIAALASRHVSFAEVVASRKVADDVGDEAK